MTRWVVGVMWKRAKGKGKGSPTLRQIPAQAGWMGRSHRIETWSWSARCSCWTARRPIVVRRSSTLLVVYSTTITVLDTAAELSPVPKVLSTLPGVNQVIPKSAGRKGAPLGVDPRAEERRDVTLQPGRRKAKQSTETTKTTSIWQEDKLSLWSSRAGLFRSLPRLQTVACSAIPPS